MTMPGWTSGRLLDGWMTQADELPAESMEPVWLRDLRAEGYEPERDGEPLFVVALVGGPDLAGYASPRAALRDALDRIRAEPDRYRQTLVVLARTMTGQSATIVSGRFVEGFALGALEAEPIRLITGPSRLPESPE